MRASAQTGVPPLVFCAAVLLPFVNANGCQEIFDLA
jgi:hypothetical protein